MEGGFFHHVDIWYSSLYLMYIQQWTDKKKREMRHKKTSKVNPGPALALRSTMIFHIGFKENIHPKKLFLNSIKTQLAEEK